jgi:hypothetical protein
VSISVHLLSILVHLFICPFVHLFVCPSVHLSICPHICSSVSTHPLSICPSVHLFVCPSVRLSAHLFVCLHTSVVHLSICSFVHLSICPSAHSLSTICNLSIFPSSHSLSTICHLSICVHPLSICSSVCLFSPSFPNPPQLLKTSRYPPLSSNAQSPPHRPPYRHHISNEPDLFRPLLRLSKPDLTINHKRWVRPAVWSVSSRFVRSISRVC